MVDMVGQRATKVNAARADATDIAASQPHGVVSNGHVAGSQKSTHDPPKLRGDDVVIPDEDRDELLRRAAQCSVGDVVNARAFLAALR